MACLRLSRRTRGFYPTQARRSIPRSLTHRNRGRMFASTIRPGFRSRVATGLIAGLSILAGCEHALTTESTRGLAPELPRLVVNPGDYVKIYVHAYQDDWELFMGDRVTTGLSTVPNVVFIYTSAGDGNQSATYWQYRERAAQAAMDVLIGSGSWTCANQAIQAHQIRQCVKGGAVAYFMRLPDGAPSGEGYSGRGSMGMLRDGQQATLTALDGSTTYTSWTDLYTTIRAIIDYESNNQAAPFVEVHAPEYDRTVNPNDHPDHLATADAVHAAAGTRSWNLAWYVDYQTKNLAVNLTQAQHDLKQAVFYAYDNFMGAGGYGREQWESDYQAWLWRTYVRTAISTPPPPPATPTNLQAVARSGTRIDLTWTDNATNETGYYVERAPDVAGVAGTYTQITTLASNSNSFSSTALSPNTAYWFRVRAFNATDVSAYSNQTSATTFLVPAAPTNLQGQAISTSRIDLTWTDNADNETGFLIERAPDNAGTPGTFAQVASVGANVVAFSNTLLNPSTRYWYRVRSYNSAQNSAYSNSASGTTLAPPTSRTDFFIHAHQDDWELFMGDRAYTSVQVATKVVFVFATAGDGGQNTAFWQTREQAAQAGIASLVTAGSWSCATQAINGHSIRRCVKGKAVTYDMRLPDGATSGEGYSGHGSMSQLRDGARATLAALDGSATYASWADLYGTIRGIVDLESGNGSAPYVEVHAPETNRTTNPGDH